MAVTDTNYNSTLAVTDNVGSGQRISGSGAFQKDIYDLLSSIITNFNAMNAKLDADGGVTDEDYSSTWNITALSANNIFDDGFSTNGLYTVLTEIETNFEGVTAKLDADAGTGDNDYASTLDFDNDANIRATGINQGDLVSCLNTIVTQFNALLTKLDAD